jgi:hypothetical protein
MKLSDLQGTSVYLLIISGVYALVLMFYANYKLYLLYGSLAIDIQGRYIFRSTLYYPIILLVSVLNGGNGEFSLL